MPWRYEAESGAFVDLETGRRLTTKEAEDLVDELIERFQDEAGDLVAELGDDPDVATFERDMSELVRNLFVILGVLGGGLAIYQSLRGRLERQLRKQFRFLENFSRQIYAGKVPLGSIRNRAHMYVNSARGAYWLTRDQAEKDRGMTVEIWHVIGDKHTCSPCSDAAEAGPQPIGTFGQPGSGIVRLSPVTVCAGMSSCRCRKSYR